MQIRCSSCGRAVTLESTGVLPERCPHCAGDAVPRVLGRFEIERLLAAGGMGEVYVARHRQLGTKVAIKLLPRPPGSLAFARLRERFLREAKLTASIEHPGVVGVLDFEEDGDRAFLVLELLTGETLRSHAAAKGGALAIEEAVRITAAVADVLAAAHARGIVHRDIKPENVLVSPDGTVRVLDFGIARLWTEAEPLTRTGEVVGTPEYMAPEQLLEAADAVDARADVHALGVLLHELLTGASPFRGANLFQALKLVESLVPPPPSKLRADVTPLLDAVVMRALAKSPAERFADAGAFAAALSSAVSSAAPRASRPGAGIGASRSSERHARSWSRPLLCGLTVAGFALGYWIAPHREPGVPELVAQSSAAVEAAQLDDARAAILSGEFHRALHDLEPSIRTASVEAIELSAVAWVCAQYLLPEMVGLPRRWHEFDRSRRDRILGSGEEPRDLDTPLFRAALALASGDAAGALERLGVAEAASQDEVHGVLRLLAARIACSDADVVLRAARRWRPERPGPVYRLLASPRDGLRAELADYIALLDAHGADRWLAAMFAEQLQLREFGGGVERLRALAELAWLTGGGEAALLRLVALRIDLAAGDSRHGLRPEDAERLLALLHGFDPKTHPALPFLQAALRVAMGERVASSDRLFGSTIAAAPLSDDLAMAILQRVVGQPSAARRALQALVAAGGADVADARLLLALFEEERADAREHWRVAADLGARLELLGWLPSRVGATPAASDFPSSTAGAEAGLLIASVFLRLGTAAQDLLEVSTMRGFREPPLRAAWVRQVQGGLDF
jgi:hypothetical protein